MTLKLTRLPLAIALSTLSLVAAAQNMPAGFGPSPALPAPEKSLIPTMNVAPADPWPKGTHPVAAAGLVVTPYASGLSHPRSLYVLPNGDVLVAETNKPAAQSESPSIKGVVMKYEQKKAGAGVTSPRLTVDQRKRA